MIGPQECQLRNGNEMAAAWSWDKDGAGECPEVEQECHYSEENYFVKRKSTYRAFCLVSILYFQKLECGKTSLIVGFLLHS